MKKRLVKLLLLVIAIPLVFYAIQTFAIFRKSGSGIGSLDTATWSVSRNQVDVLYKIIISNLPADVEVDLDNTGYLPPTASGSLTIETANTVINYNDAIKTKTHTLTFRATSEASFITNQEINIDVEFRQDV